MSSQIRGLFSLIVGLVFMYFFVQTANSIGAPFIFTIVAALGALLMILKFGRILIRGF